MKWFAVCLTLSVGKNVVSELICMKSAENIQAAAAQIGCEAYLAHGSSGKGALLSFDGIDEIDRSAGRTTVLTIEEVEAGLRRKKGI